MSSDWTAPVLSSALDIPSGVALYAAAAAAAAGGGPARAAVLSIFALSDRVAVAHCVWDKCNIIGVVVSSHPDASASYFSPEGEGMDRADAVAAIVALVARGERTMCSQTLVSAGGIQLKCAKDVPVDTLEDVDLFPHPFLSSAASRWVVTARCKLGAASFGAAWDASPASPDQSIVRPGAALACWYSNAGASEYFVDTAALVEAVGDAIAAGDSSFGPRQFDVYRPSLAAVPWDTQRPFSSAVLAPPATSAAVARPPSLLVANRRSYSAVDPRARRYFGFMDKSMLAENSSAS
jgi:hypothetical protein